MHPSGAATGPFAGLSASGVHPLGGCLRLYVDHYISRAASLAPPGLDRIRWPRPVRPGDRLRIRVTVAEARASRPKRDRGLVHPSGEALNQEDSVVLSFTGVNFFSRLTSS